MISVLLPTRKRPHFLERMINSLFEMSATKPEVVVYVDDDDPESAKKAEELGLKLIVGPRIIMTDYWNKCYEKSKGDIVMQAGDDIIFRTKGWDEMVEEAFAKSHDKILLVHGDDLEPCFGRNFGTHSLLHRRWVETLGYFIPPYFSSDNGDRWLMEIADFLGRRLFLPFVTEHMHYRTGKAQFDSTYTERLQRHQRDNPNALYNKMSEERLKDVEKLHAVITFIRGGYQSNKCTQNKVIYEAAS